MSRDTIDRKHPCGCVEGRRTWLALCPPHAAEVAERHAAHAADMAARREPGQAATAIESAPASAHNGLAE